MSQMLNGRSHLHDVDAVSLGAGPKLHGVLPPASIGSSAAAPAPTAAQLNSLAALRERHRELAE
jgi:hypothetical protein